MQALNNSALTSRPRDIYIQGLCNPLTRQTADHCQTSVSRKSRSRPLLTCRARYGDSEELRTQKKALEALLKTSKEADGMDASLP